MRITLRDGRDDVVGERVIVARAKNHLVRRRTELPGATAGHVGVLAIPLAEIYRPRRYLVEPTRQRMPTELTLPDAEAALLRHHLDAAAVVLEYGSGGSTRLAAEMRDKFVISVESDRDWAIALQSELDAAELPSPAIVRHVDIGPTGRWGRPVDALHWTLFYRYSLEIWDAPFFRHPDLVFIDGRFRPACLAATCLRIKRPVTVLFDDYVNRPAYHAVEEIAAPVETVGRMARFELIPNLIPREKMTLVMSLFFEATYSSENVRYNA